MTSQILREQAYIASGGRVSGLYSEWRQGVRLIQRVEAGCQAYTASGGRVSGGIEEKASEAVGVTLINIQLARQ
jgi:hypothetical protein